MNPTNPIDILNPPRRALAARPCPGGDSQRRSIAKALTYRAGGLLVTGAVAWLITGEARVAVAVGALDTAAKLFAYYVHERLWERIPLGRPRPPEHKR